MNDPHVDELKYRLDHEPTVSYKEPPSIKVAEADFDAILENGTLVCKMKTHYATEKAARAVVENFLNVWAFDVELSRGRRELGFIFEDSKLVDRNPPPPGSSQVISLQPADFLILANDATFRIQRNEYPNPPKGLKFSADVDTLWHRYQLYMKDREPLLGMAYFCLTLMESRAGNRKKAALVFAIDKKVLDKMGELTSTRGDLKTGRKVKGTLKPLSVREKEWIETTLKRFIRRVAEFDFNPTSPFARIGLADLPKL